jgi:small subunit ribosomal protein S4e
MTRGPKKHLKRLAAPKSWMLDKLGGVYTVRPSSGPHKLKECLPISLFLRNRLKYALNMKEVQTILKQRLIKIDGKVRTDEKFPCGFNDVIQIEKNNEQFRLLYDVKGRFTVHRITPQEATYKLVRVKSLKTGPRNVPFLTTSDGRTIRYPDPLVKVNDTIRLDLKTYKILDFIKFETGNQCMVTGGRNTGRVGTILNIERHKGSFDIVHVKDAGGHTFSTRLAYIFVIGKGMKSLISLPEAAGVRMGEWEQKIKKREEMK